MIRVIDMKKVGLVGNLPEIKFDFEFDNASTLPERTYSLEQQTYLIAEGSVATNIAKNIVYRYETNKWVKALSVEVSIPTNINSITNNGNFDIINNDFTGYNNLTVNVSGGGDTPTPTPTLINKTITLNGEYSAQSDDADGYANVSVSVPNTYTQADEGKVVSNGELTAQTSTTQTNNGIYDITTNNSITINVSNTYTNEDEGKVVNNGSLVSQTSTTTNTNGLIDTTLINSLDVEVPNTYTLSDEGKVVKNGELISQIAYPITVTENDTYDTTNYNSITVNVSGGGGGTGGDVVFYDYDGSVVASYSAADFANLSAMPANPTHTGLTAQGWNWSLADAKAYVASYGKLNIGQMYITSDGKTRLYFTVPKDNLSVELYLNLASGTELDVDWGDGTGHTTWTSNDGGSSKTHTYANGGKYTVAITVVSGGFSCQSSGSTDYTLKKVEFGSNVTSIGESAFRECTALASVTIPSSVTSIGDYAVRECSALTSITIPSSVTSIGEYAFYVCPALVSITIPSSITSTENSAFYQCSALTSIIIPSSVTSIGDYTFDMCTALASVTIPSSVTSIGSGAFEYCSALTSITIPSSVEYIGEYAFQYCAALSSITFESTTPPELGESLGIPTTCIIRVPQGTLSDYTSASNYPDPNDYTYVEY